MSSWGGAKVYVWAGWASAEATFVKGKQLIKLKVKTQMVGSGRPQAIRGGEAAYDGYVECADDAAALKRWIRDKEMETW